MGKQLCTHFYFKLRSKREASKILGLAEQKTVLHVSGMYPAVMGCLSPVVPLLQHPVNSNEVLVYDLRLCPKQLLSMTGDDIAKNLYTKTIDLPEGVIRVGLKSVHINKSPALAPINTLDKNMAAKWDVDWDKVEQHRQQLLADDTLIKRLAEMYQKSSRKDVVSDADSAIYEGFINKNDRSLCNQVLKKTPQQLVAWKPTFDDQRLNTLYPRYLARNWLELLDSEQREKWQRFCQARIMDGEFDSTLTMDAFQQSIQSLLTEELPEKKQLILKKLVDWVTN